LSIEREENRLLFEGSYNFRDLGGFETIDGFTTKYNLIFRSDALHEMTDADSEIFQNELKITTVIDMRTDNAIQKEGLGKVINENIKRIHIPLFSDSDATEWSQKERAPEEPADLVAFYIWVMEKSGDQIVDVIENLIKTDDSVPAVFHCFAGKDRTGIIAAVVLSLLNVHEDHIVDDYAESHKYKHKILERMKRSMTEENYEKFPKELMDAYPETLVAVLQYINNTYGSMKAYALSKGLSNDSIIRMKNLFLE